MGQLLMSPRFEKKSEMTAWKHTMGEARQALKRGDEISASQRRVLERAGFKFEVFEGDIYVEDLAAKFLKHRATHYVASTTSFNLTHVRKYIIPQFGNRNVYGIKQSEVRKFIENLKIRKHKGYHHKVEKGEFVPDLNRPIYIETEEKAGKSLKKAVLGTFSLMFDFAREEEIVSDKFVNPAHFAKTRGSRKAAAKVSRPLWKQKNDALAWLAVAKQGTDNYPPRPKMYVFGVMGLEGGPRKGELIALKWKDVDSRTGIIKIGRQLEQVTGEIVERTKSGESVERKIPLTAGIKVTLDDWKQQSRFTKPDDFILANDDGGPMSPRSLWQWFVEICAQAKVENITPHGLRHTFATHFIMAGGRVEDLQKLLGHASIVTTQVYVHLVEEMFRGTRPDVSFTSIPDFASETERKA